MNRLFKPYWYRSTFFTYICFGLNKVFDIKISKSGILIALCKFNTINKRIEFDISRDGVLTTKY